MPSLVFPRSWTLMFGILTVCWIVTTNQPTIASRRSTEHDEMVRHDNHTAGQNKTITSSNVTEPSRKSTLTPTRPPNTPSVKIKTENGVVYIGDDVELLCEIEKTEWFTCAKWMKIKHPTTTEFLTEKEFSLNGSVSEQEQKAIYHFPYNIPSTSIASEGNYTCKAEFFNSSSIPQFTVFDYYTLKLHDERKSSDEKTWTSALISLAVVSGFLCLCIMIVLVCYRRRVKAQRNDGTREAADNLGLETLDNDQRYLSVTASRWEIPSKAIVLQNVLGSGFFGEVWKASASGLKGMPGETIVAVKKLKHNSSDSEKESLVQEIELGKSLEGDRHPNIVNFLGCVSTTNPMMLILEYVQYGDLLGYLRKSRGMEDKYYSCPEGCQQEVTPYHLFSFAQQIASGMSFLASKEILHRDLAARNVLVSEGMICKITDFGLALIRDKYQYLYCTLMRKGRLPIKWTAPEHLFNDSPDKDVRVSEKSDVWSYGVVLYEIFTLGGMPYPGWNEWKVVYELKVNKYRMGQPEHVSDELYQIMLDCWSDDPNNRPTFDRLYEITTEFLQEEHYVDLDMSKYEASLYTNVEEFSDVGNASSAHGTLKDPNDVANTDTRL